MTIYKDIDISKEIEIDVSIYEIYNALRKGEKEELFEILLDDRTNYSDNILENLFIGKSDVEILTNKKIIDKLIRTIKYNHVDPELVNYFIDELSY